MHGSKTKKIILIAFLAAGIIALYFWMNRSVINRSYLASDEYQQLEQELSSERERDRSANKTPADVFEELLSSEKVIELSVPFTLDSLLLDNYQSRFEEIPIRDNGNRQGHTFYEVGVIESNSVNLFVVLVEYPSVYTNLEIWMATEQNGELVDTEMVAEYKNSITDYVYTELEIDDQHRVESLLTRRRKYPIQQESDEWFRYEVTDSATIELQSPT